jgi:group I intron endonuclease
MTRLSCIYYIHCKETNKGYVGQHNEVSPIKRFKSHIQQAKRNKPERMGVLHHAINKYGQESFTIETLCVVPEEAISRMEEYWAEQLGTYTWDYPGGYNMIWCGDTTRTGFKASEETKKKQSEAAKGRIVSEETKKKLSEAFKNMSEETKNKMIAGNKNRKKPPPRTVEHREKMRSIMKKKWEEGTSPILKALEAQKSNEYKEKAKAILTERNKSAEQIQKARAFHIGRKRSEETCRKISEARKASFAKKKALLGESLIDINNGNLK